MERKKFRSWETRTHDLQVVSPSPLPSNHRGIIYKMSKFLIFIKKKFSKTENLEKTCEDKYSQNFDKFLTTSFKIHL